MAGTVTPSCTYSGKAIIYKLTFTADSDGMTYALLKIPSYYLYTARVIPGSGAGSFDLTIVDSNSVDLLGGAGVGMTSSGGVVTPTPVYPVYDRTCTVTISSGYGNGVSGIVELTFVPVT